MIAKYQVLKRLELPENFGHSDLESAVLVSMRAVERLENVSFNISSI